MWFGIVLSCFFFFLQQRGKHIRMCQEALQAVSFTGRGSYQLPKVLPNSVSEKNNSKKKQKKTPPASHKAERLTVDV